MSKSASRKWYDFIIMPLTRWASIILLAPCGALAFATIFKPDYAAWAAGAGLLYLISLSIPWAWRQWREEMPTSGVHDQSPRMKVISRALIGGGIAWSILLTALVIWAEPYSFRICQGSEEASMLARFARCQLIGNDLFAVISLAIGAVLILAGGILKATTRERITLYTILALAVLGGSYVGIWIEDDYVLGVALAATLPIGAVFLKALFRRKKLLVPVLAAAVSLIAALASYIGYSEFRGASIAFFVLCAFFVLLAVGLLITAWMLWSDRRPRTSTIGLAAGIGLVLALNVLGVAPFRCQQPYDGEYIFISTASASSPVFIDPRTYHKCHIFEKRFWEDPADNATRAIGILFDDVRAAIVNLPDRIASRLEEPYVDYVSPRQVEVVPPPGHPAPMEPIHDLAPPPPPIPPGL